MPYSVEFILTADKWHTMTASSIKVEIKTLKI